MKATNKLIKSALLGLSLTTLAACVHSDVNTATTQQNVMRNSVQMVRLPLEIKPEDDGTATLSAATQASIAGFFSSVEIKYGDVIMLDGPAASTDRLAAIEDMIRRTGITYGGVTALGNKPADGAVMLYVERYVVTTPNCNYWPEVTSQQEKNNDSSFHGCASTINLGLMVANPRDLVAGRYNGTSTKTAVSAILGRKNSGASSGSSSSSSGTSGSSSGGN